VIIAIDGPSGSGKSTIAKGLARRFGSRYLDTGAMYRALALKAMRLGLSGADPEGLSELAGKVVIGFEGPPEAQRALLDGEDVSDEIRLPRVGDLASAISVWPPVRRRMVALQQAIIAEGGWTMDGRDTTTVVAPNADVKVYLDASPEERARRRTLELGERGVAAEYAEVLADMRERDTRDRTRADSPLTVAPDAAVVNTDGLGIEQVVDRIAELVR
jgi:cytidylate kinase